MSKDTAGQQGRRSFDEIEGKKYKREKILVRRPGGEVVEAITYRVITPETGKKSNLAYVGYIIRGVRERGAGETDISRVKKIAAKKNPELAEAVNGL